MDTFLQDFRYGVRNLLRQRGSSIVAVVTLALGIGASTAIFSVVDAAMLRPLPYPQPEQLVSVYPEQVGPDGKVDRATASMEDMRFMQKADDVFSQVAAWGSAFRGRIAEGPEPERIQVAHFTEDYLPMHGVTPQKGRGFTLTDMQPDAPLVALLGHGYWQSRFGGGDVLGQTIRLEEDIAEIVGVLPPWFNASTAVSIPHRVAPAEFGRRGTGRVSIYARLRDGVTIEQATERMSARMATWTPSGGGRPPAGVGRASISSRLDAATSAAQTTVNILLGAVGLILLIACVNVAGLLLARGANRQGELAVRASLGASRWRLIRQVLTESVVLVIPGAAVGVLLAWLTLDAIVANIPLSLPSNSPVALNLTVLAGTVALLVPTVLLFGLAPAIKLSRVRLGSVLARGGRQRGSSLSRRGSQLLIGVEIALAVVLVAGAGLMIRSFARIGDVDLGFNASRLLTMDVLPLDRTPGVHKQYYTSLVQQVRLQSGVTSAGLIDNFALGGATTVTSVRPPGGEWTGVALFRHLPGYFETIGATLKQGRWLTDAEYGSGFRGAVINESAARALFPQGGALGREISGSGSKEMPWSVIGIVGDLRHGGPLASTTRYPAQVFLPLEPTEYDVTTAMVVVMRVEGAPANLPDQLRKTAQSIGPRVLVERIRTSEALFSDRVITPRRRMVLLSLLGGLGLILALVGVFGMTAYAVARRTPEIGVRLAFGARPRQIVGTMLRESAWPVMLGTVVGVGGALLATRVIETFLFQTSPTDPMTLAAVAGLLAAVGCLAAIVPALRAATVDPLSSLRAE